VVVLEAARMAGITVAGFLDDNPASSVAAVIIDTTRPRDGLLDTHSLAHNCFDTAPPLCLGKLNETNQLDNRAWIIALGDIAHRRRAINAAQQRDALNTAAARSGVDLRPASAPGPKAIIHPSAFISPTAQIGPGAFIGPRAVVHARARIGPHAIINTGAIIEHDCVVGENSHIAPGTVLGGGVHIASDSLIGLGSRILPGVSIGHHVIIGAGATVLGDVRDGTTAVGVIRAT